MAELQSAALFLVLSMGAVSTAAVLIRLLRDGSSEISDLRRKGYGLRAMWSGSIPKPNSGSTIDVMEGLEFIAERGEIVSVRQTRTISREIA